MLCKGTAQPYWQAKQTYGHTYGSGGHFHYNPAPPPPLKMTKVSLNPSLPPYSGFKPTLSPVGYPSMSVNVSYYSGEWMPEFGTQIGEWFESYGACTGMQTDYLNVKVPGLVELEVGAEYNLVGDTPEHPYNHFGRPETITLLKSIAQDYYSQFSTYPRFSKLEINDMSLVWGGVFDVSNNWKPDHQEHRYGRQVDVRRINWSSSGQMIYMPNEQWKKLVEISCKNKVEVLVEDKNGNLINIFKAEDWLKSTAPHFHLRFPISANGTESPPDVAPDLSRCPKFLEELRNKNEGK